MSATTNLNRGIVTANGTVVARKGCPWKTEIGSEWIAAYSETMSPSDGPELGRSAQKNGVIAKPIPPNDLLALLEELINRSDEG